MKLKTILTTAFLTTIMVVPTFAFSQMEGTVTDVRETEVMIETESGNYSISLEDTAILKDRHLVSSEKIEEGDELIVVYESQTFSSLIYPPRRVAHTALVLRSENENLEDMQKEESHVINMLDLLPYHARGNNQNSVQDLEEILDTNYHTGLEIFEVIFNF